MVRKLILIVLLIAAFPLCAKPLLTKEEEVAAAAYMVNELKPNHGWVTHLYNSKDHPKTDLQLRRLDNFRAKVERGGVTDANDVVITMGQVEKWTLQLDRDYWSDPNMILGVINGDISPLDGSEQ